MLVFRIAQEKYIRDLSGTGSRLFGGRWNYRGTSILHTSESRALATVELLVHAPLATLPTDLSILSIEIPGHIAPKEVSASDLTPDWWSYPAPLKLADLGSKWALSHESLLLRVPSAVVEQEYNILINPFHPDFKLLSVHNVESYLMIRD